MNRYPAGFGIRWLASIIDVLVIAVIGGLVIYFLNNGFAIDWTNGTVGQLVYTLYLTITPVLWGGYVIGKRICKIKIKRYKDDQNVSFYNMVMREFVGYYLLGGVTLGLSIIVSVFMVLFREDKRKIHDFIGGTYVTTNT